MPNILDLVFPPKCIFCENYGYLICDSCLKSFRVVCKYHSFHMCFSPLPLNSAVHSFDFGSNLEKNRDLKVFSYFVYEDKIRQCIKYSKYSKKQFSILREISKYAVADMLTKNIVFPQAFVVPIPLSKERQRNRGFNQAEIIASVFAKGYNLSLQKSILSRQRETTAQHRLNREMRLENLKGAFAVKDCVRGYSFILVDDICTTGATLIESAKALYLKGAKEVAAFTLSKRL